MESAIRRLKINSLKGILEHSRITCASLETEFNQPHIPSHKRLELFKCWDAVMRNSYAARLELAVLEEAEQEGYGDPDVVTFEDF